MYIICSHEPYLAFPNEIMCRMKRMKYLCKHLHFKGFRFSGSDLKHLDPKAKIMIDNLRLSCYIDKNIEVIFHLPKIEIIFHLPVNWGSLPFCQKIEVVFHFQKIEFVFNLQNKLRCFQFESYYTPVRFLGQHSLKML